MIRIAVPSKGRLKEPSMKLLEDAGLKLVDGGDESLFIKTSNENIDIISARAEDIPEYVQDGAADLGITGRDLVVEKGAEVREMLPLNFGYCKLVVAAPICSKIAAAGDLPKNARIATKFVNVTKNYIRDKGVDATVIPLAGSVEIAPMIEVSDAIIDLTSSGTTLKRNGLRVVDTIFESQAVLIGNPKSLVDSDKTTAIDDLFLAVKGVVNAERKRYLMLNLPEEKLADLVKICGGALSPTLMKLDKKGWLAVHIVVDSDRVLEIIKRLKRLGARDILVLPIERMVD